MKRAIAHRVAMIPTKDVTVLNPRARDKARFREITQSIGRVGLKRPITVARLTSGEDACAYGVVCGEGRLKACIDLGQTEVAAIVIDATLEECLLMSLVENCARRQHQPADLLRDVGALRKRGYTDRQIAGKIGYTSEWVNMIGGLIEHGEERLLAAVETGMLPLSVAVEIARADEDGTQMLLAQAYEEGKLSGGKLTKVRRMLEARQRQGPEERKSRFGPKARSARPTSTDALVLMLQREGDRQRMYAKKAEFTGSRILFIEEAIRLLRADEHFATLLRAEGLDTMPAELDRRTNGRAA